MAGIRVMEWFKFFGWSDNPFKIRPDPRNIVGFIDMRTRLLTYIKSEDPFIVTGVTGAGKTTLLKWLEENKENSVYFNFLDDVKEKEFKKAIEGSFWEKLLNLFSDHRKLVLIDEAQDMPPKLLKWLRGRFDEGEISSVVLASIKEDLNNLEEPFADRIGRRVIYVRKLTEEEAFKMVKQRIFGRGGVNPFTEEGLRRIFEISRFSPRKILENCESCCIYAVKEDAKYINRSVVNKALESVEHKAEQRADSVEEPQGYRANLKNLSPGQQRIINMLQGREMTTKQIAEEIKASRASIAKQLSRLSFKTDKKILRSKGFRGPLVEAKNKGRPVIYGLTELAKQLLKNK